MIQAQVGIADYFQFVDKVAPFLDAELINDAHEIEYGQWELPFEALLLEIMKLSNAQIDIDLNLVVKLAHEADIVESSVLDINTWEQFKKWSKLR